MTGCRERITYDPCITEAGDPDGIPHGGRVRWLDQGDVPGIRANPDDPSLLDLRTIPARIPISGAILRVWTYMWHDFMPST